MEKVLVLLHTVDGELPAAAMETLGLAQRLGAAYELGVIGAGAAAAAQRVSGGAGKCFAVEGEAFSVSRYATDAAACEAVIRASGAPVVLAPDTLRFHRCLPGVAERLGAAVDTHVVAFTPEGAVERWFYRQRIQAELKRTERPWIVLVEPGSQPAAETSAGAAPEVLEVSCETRTSVEGFSTPLAGEQTIRPDAPLLFVAGAGWTKKQKDGAVHVEEAAQLILDFVRKTQCSLGSSKSLVDLTSEGQPVLPFLTHLHQVGQTGSSPRHRKGLATCCHGEEPHVVGWRFIQERRAVNLDPNCGWTRGKADVVYVADAFEVMRELLKLL
ncbi:MAG: electron transfer flavoprotein subunit alpha [Bryobacteraceae bacterium]|nr:electron transfer flavoprotein subunit alpha [Bryobacteraceae bacterium]